MAGTQQQNPMLQNLQMRQALLQQGVPMRKYLGSFGPFALGQSVQLPLDRMGVFTQLKVQVTANVTITTAAATPSNFGAYPLISNVMYRDFNAVNRVNTSGPFLYLLNSLRGGWLFNNAYTSQNFAQVGAVDTNQYSLPTAVGANQTINFGFDVPLAYDPKADLRGAVLAQTVVGDHYLFLTFANAAGSTTDAMIAPYNSTAANVAISNIQVTVWEDYIQPQNLGTLPQIDLSTIYGIEGNYSSSANLASNTPFYINYPNNRSILQSIHVYQNNGAFTLNGTDVGEVDLIANANTQLRQDTPYTLRRWTRAQCGGDLPSGVYVIDSRKNPIATTLYGNVQAKFNILNAGSGTGPTQFLTQFEDFYPAGVPLPGVAAGY